MVYFEKRLYTKYRQLGWLCTRWGEIVQSLNFKYLYKSHCKSCELLWVFQNRVSLKSPQQIVGFAVTLEKIFKVYALCNFTPPCAKPPRLTVQSLRAKFLDNFSDFVYFPLNFRFLEDLEKPQKRASRAAGWPTLHQRHSYTDQQLNV